ncbi:hypothetical protein BLNAU_3255 [Blattamonas nauphoetae]|uniref:Uncharacterized protein n=1 Tax=Blattamonas nauphoetae TaxID=2049346 RepID=A0ABQ9YDH9_9EUKA|nr:hypothetical protein BLNAU_3255 [Blattamonas nauphoetae]
MISSEDYSPFLTWKANNPITVDSIAQAFVSLVSMIRDDSDFDEELVSQASQFVSSLSRHLFKSDGFEEMLNIVGQGSPNPAAVLYPYSTRLTLVSSKLIPRMLSTPHLHDLSVVADKRVLKAILLILNSGVWLTSSHNLRALSTTLHPDPESVRDVVLHEVLVPMEPSLVQISRHPNLFLWSVEYKQMLELLSCCIDTSAFHQPTLDFICSSHIPMAFQSLLAKVESESIHQLTIWLVTNYIAEWKHNGAETVLRGKILLQTLEQEGFRNHLEQTLFNDKASEDGSTSLNQPKQCDIHFCRKLTDHSPTEPLTRYTSRILPSLSNIHKLSSALHASRNNCLRHKDLSRQGISVPPITDQFEETAASWRQRDTGGHRALRSPDPGTDGLVHADIHLTMSKCAAQDVIVGLSPIFGLSSSSVDVSFSAFANLDHAVPLLSSPRPPALQPSSIPSLAKYSTLVAYSLLVSVFDHIFAGITNAPISGEVVLSLRFTK